MTDKTLVEVVTVALCGRADCGYPSCTKRKIGRCQTPSEKCQAALAAIGKAGYVVVPKEPTLDDLERMAGPIHDGNNQFYHSGTLPKLANARQIHRDIALSAVRVAHAALVRGDG